MLDGKDKYKIVFEQTAGFKRDLGLSVTEAALSGLAEPPKVIVAANDDMALGAMEAVKGRGLSGIAIIGFDALPEALAQVRDGGLTATIEQFPGQQSALGVQTLVAFLKDGTKPAEKILLLTRARHKVAITATQMMESMVHQRMPTRAEVSDVANAVMDGTDAVMLSAETAVGEFPVRAVAAMSEVWVGAET